MTEVRLNVCYALLDAAVVAGRADEPVVGSVTHARLLEDTAAIGGVLVHAGALPGGAVLVDREDDYEAVVAALAVARVGAVVVGPDEPPLEPAPLAWPDVEWDVLLRAGRTDPAVVELLPREAAYSLRRGVAEQVERLAGEPPPWTLARARELLLD